MPPTDYGSACELTRRLENRLRNRLEDGVSRRAVLGGAGTLGAAAIGMSGSAGTNAGHDDAGSDHHGKVGAIGECEAGFDPHAFPRESEIGEIASMIHERGRLGSATNLLAALVGFTFDPGSITAETGTVRVRDPAPARPGPATRRAFEHATRSVRVSEFDFEIRLCARLERDGAPGDGAPDGDPIVARQIGGGVDTPGARIVDIVLVDPGGAFPERAAITPGTIPDLAIEADVPVGRAVPRREAFADLDIAPGHQRAVAERAAEVGFLERERRSGREFVRQVAAYPDWYGGLVAIENKPDLGEPGDLDRQLRFDVALALFDRVVLATGSHVTRGHLNRLPDAVGVWQFRGGTIDVVRESEHLAVGDPGIEIVDEAPARTAIEPVASGRKERARRRIAERAYGKGWRTYDFPACARIEAVEREGAGGLPHCGFHERFVEPGSECGPACPGYDPADPPDIGLAGARAENSPWVADPDGRARRQSGLREFKG
jgi:hypothetical protein